MLRSYFSVIFVYGKGITVVCITVPWECLMRYFWSGQSSSMELKFPRYWANVVQMFMTHLQNGMHMFEVDSVVENILGYWEKAAEKQEWHMGCSWMSFFVLEACTYRRKPNSTWVFVRSFLLNESSLLSLVRSPKGCSKAQVLCALSFVLLFLDFTFRMSSVRRNQLCWPLDLALPASESMRKQITVV